jgi:hypothetical protein
LARSVTKCLTPDGFSRINPIKRSKHLKKGVCEVARPTKSKRGAAVKLSVTVSPESAAKLEAYCRKNDRGRSWVIEKLIARYLEKLP